MGHDQIFDMSEKRDRVIYVVLVTIAALLGACLLVAMALSGVSSHTE